MTTSWVIVDRATGKAVFETWSDETVTWWRRHTDRVEIVPIGEWLARVNAEARH